MQHIVYRIGKKCRVCKRKVEKPNTVTALSCYKCLAVCLRQYCQTLIQYVLSTCQKHTNTPLQTSRLFSQHHPRFGESFKKLRHLHTKIGTNLIRTILYDHIRFTRGILKIHLPQNLGALKKNTVNSHFKKQTNRRKITAQLGRSVNHVCLLQFSFCRT